MSTADLSIASPATLAVTPEQALEQYRALRRIQAEVMEQGVDYDVIPGTQKPSLLKAGAEHLLQFHGLGHRLSLVEKQEDWAAGFFMYVYDCAVFKARVNPVTGEYVEQVIATAQRSCNSKENRYRNQDVYMIANTLRAMAQKRALVGAARQATGASGLFEEIDEEDARNLRRTARTQDRVRVAAQKATAAAPRPPQPAPQQPQHAAQATATDHDARQAVKSQFGRLKLAGRAIADCLAPFGVVEASALSEQQAERLDDVLSALATGTPVPDVIAAVEEYAGVQP